MINRRLPVCLFVCLAAVLTLSTSASAQTDWIICAWEGATCTFSGTQEVRYGVSGSYVYATLSNGTACTNDVFGDPAVGASKNCATRSSGWTACATEGGTCSFSGTKEVRYGANGSFVYRTLSNGTACSNGVFGDPAVGALKTCATGGTAAAEPAPPPSGSAVGPQPAITCPAGAVDVFPGSDIQSIVNQYGGDTAFCLRAGIHYRRSSVTPKSGNTFVGEYGAVMDGTGWSTGDGTQAAFRAHNQDIDDVTIRNLVIRNMPQRGIHAYYWMSDRWTIESNEIAASANTGIVIPPSSMIRNNHIHHNNFAGYMGPYAHNSTFEGNEIAYNGDGQKLGETANVTFRNNFVHHNVGGGIWYDSNNTGALIEGNRVEDNLWMGIFYEISSGAIIRNNTIRRNGEAGIMLSVSKNVQICNNTLENNFRGITYFLNCPSVGGPTNFDLTNNSAYDNTITVGTQSGAYASLFSYGSSCSASQAAPYLNGLKNLTFSRNTYRVPSVSGRYLVWGPATKSWAEWQALGQDANGTMSQ